MRRIIPAVFACAIVLPALSVAAQSQSQAQSSQEQSAQGQQTQGQASSGSAQPSTLGELAKKEAERRKAAAAQGQAPKKVYTNSDLSAPPAPQTSDSPDAAAKDTKDAKDAKETKDKDAADKDKPAPEKTEEYWRKRMDTAREEVRRNEMFRDALQARINGLTADFSARDDPYQRAQIADDRQKALAELGRVNDEIEKGKKAIADIEEDARKANVPAGWIR